MPWDDVLQRIEPDGSVCAEVGSWAEEKHRLLAHYATLFVRSMRAKWDELVYLDLYSGPGECRIRGSARHYRSSPTIIYELEDAFSSYIFCDFKQENIEALRARLTRLDQPRKFTLFCGDANEIVREALDAIPRGSKTKRVLSFCFLDPFKLSNLRFETVRSLADRYIDFLVLIPSGMDAHRNVSIYTQEANVILDSFLGNAVWRERWITEQENGALFEQFVCREFGRSMEALDYIDPGLERLVPIRSQDKNLLLYRLGLYSRNKLGTKFWTETQKYTNPQTGFDF